jgi:hypothetical protein
MTCTLALNSSTGQAMVWTSELGLDPIPVDKVWPLSENAETFVTTRRRKTLKEVHDE